jgi:hypothetical protein
VGFGPVGGFGAVFASPVGERTKNPDPPSPTVTVPNGRLPLGAWLILLEDAAGVRFYAAGNGLTAVPSDRLPAKAATVRDLWRPAQDPTEQPVLALGESVMLGIEIKDQPLVHVADLLQSKARVMVLVAGPDEDGKVSLPLRRSPMPLSDWLQVIEAARPDLRVVVREYGFLITTLDRRPAGAPLAREQLDRLQRLRPPPQPYRPVPPPSMPRSPRSAEKSPPPEEGPSLPSAKPPSGP